MNSNLTNLLTEDALPFETSSTYLSTGCDLYLRAIEIDKIEMKMQEENNFLPLINFESEAQFQNQIFNIISIAGSMNRIKYNYTCQRCYGCCGQKCSLPGKIKSVTEYEKFELNRVFNLLDAEFKLNGYNLRSIICSPNNDLFKKHYVNLDLIDLRDLIDKRIRGVYDIYLFDKCPNNIIYGLTEPEHIGIIPLRNHKNYERGLGILNIKGVNSFIC